MSGSAVVSGPIPGAVFLGQPVSYDLAALGYSTEEFFVEGTARSDAPAGGGWTVLSSRTGRPDARSPPTA